MSTNKKPNLRRRRSSLPNLKIMPITMAQRRLLARQKRQHEAKAAKLAKEKAAEEKRQRAKELRKTTKDKEKQQNLRRQMTMIGKLIHCRYCHDMVDEMEFDDHKVSHPSRIRSRIWLGNAENSKDLSVMKQCGITHILNCTKEIQLTTKISKKIKAFKRISIQDKNHETILNYINESNAFIEKALGQNKVNVVFVHCREGRSRSVSFLCAYLMWKERDSFHAILADITSKRHIVLPNNKFYSELEKFDKQIVVDRKNNCRKFGKPNKSYKLGKVVGKQSGGNGGGNYRHFTFADDIKSNEEELSEYELSLLAGRASKERRRSSLSDIDLSSPLSRSSIKLAFGFSGRAFSPTATGSFSPKYKGSVPGPGPGLKKKANNNYKRETKKTKNGMDNDSKMKKKKQISKRDKKKKQISKKDKKKKASGPKKKTSGSKKKKKTFALLDNSY